MRIHSMCSGNVIELRSLQEKVKQNVTKKRLERHKQGSVCTNIDADKLVSLGMDNISFYDNDRK